MNWLDIWEAEAAKYPKVGDVVRDRRVIRADPITIIFANARNGAGAYFTDLPEWRLYASGR